MMKMASIIVFAAPVALALTVNTFVAENTPLAGGSGGTSYTIKCREGEVVIGLDAYVGQWLDGVAPVCAKANLASGGWSNAYTASMRAGMYNGHHEHSSCPAGQAMREFEGKAGWYVNSIEGRCYTLGAGGRIGSSASGYVSIDGSGEAPDYGPHRCTSGRPAIGIRGKAGTFVDSFGFICDYIMPGVPVLISPAGGTQVTNRRPTFDWDDDSRVTEPYRICLNLTSGADCAISGTLTATVNLPASKWTPTSDLPFARGDVVYWRVEGCNLNGCKNKSSSFRYMP